MIDVLTSIPGAQDKGGILINEVIHDVLLFTENANFINRRTKVESKLNRVLKVTSPH
jgi:hypothetical protein